MPLTTRADSNDEALAFVAGAVVGHVIGSHADHVRQVHWPYRHHEPAVRHFRWKADHNRFDRRFERKHYKHQHPKYEHRRHERRGDRWGGRHRRGDRWHDRCDDRRS